MSAPGHLHRMRARRLGIDTHSDAFVFMRKDSPVCRSEGFASHNRILLCAGDRHIIATLYQVEAGFLALDEAGLSDTAWRRLGLKQGDEIVARHSPPLESLSLVRSRIYGHDLSDAAFPAIARRRSSSRSLPRLA